MWPPPTVSSREPNMTTNDSRPDKANGPRQAESLSHHCDCGATYVSTHARDLCASSHVIDGDGENRNSGNAPAAPIRTPSRTERMDGRYHRFYAISKQLRLLANSADSERDAAALQALQDDLAHAAPLTFEPASALGGDGDA